MQDTVEELWNVAYNIFEKRPLGAFKSIFGMRGMVNDVQFRLQKNIQALRTSTSEENVSAVRGDILLAESLGILPAKTAEKMQQLLDSINEKGKAKS